MAVLVGLRDRWLLYARTARRRPVEIASEALDLRWACRSTPGEVVAVASQRFSASARRWPRGRLAPGGGRRPSTRVPGAGIAACAAERPIRGAGVQDLLIFPTCPFTQRRLGAAVRRGRVTSAAATAELERLAWTPRGARPAASPAASRRVAWPAPVLSPGSCCSTSPGRVEGRSASCGPRWGPAAGGPVLPWCQHEPSRDGPGGRLVVVEGAGVVQVGPPRSSAQPRSPYVAQLVGSVTSRGTAGEGGRVPTGPPSSPRLRRGDRLRRRAAEEVAVCRAPLRLARTVWPGRWRRSRRWEPRPGPCRPLPLWPSYPRRRRRPVWPRATRCGCGQGTTSASSGA